MAWAARDPTVRDRVSRQKVHNWTDSGESVDKVLRRVVGESWAGKTFQKQGEH